MLVYECVQLVSFQSQESCAGYCQYYVHPVDSEVSTEFEGSTLRYVPSSTDCIALTTFVLFDKRSLKETPRWRFNRAESLLCLWRLGLECYHCRCLKGNGNATSTQHARHEMKITCQAFRPPRPPANFSWSVE